MSDAHMVHWDDVARHRVEQGPLGADWINLGVALGTVTTGLRRVDILAEKRSLPAHVHGAEEEIYFVLDGSGLCWQDGSVCAIAAGDCIVELPGKAAHTLVAGAQGLSVLAYGPRLATEFAYLPRAHVSWLGHTWVTTGDGEHPWARELSAGELLLPEPQPRPANVVNVSAVGPVEGGRGDTRRVRRDLATAAGSRSVGLQHVTVAPGMLGCPPHCHSLEEEIFVVLEGDGVLLLGGGQHPVEEVPVRPGHVVARPAGSGVAHAFRAGEGELAYLAFGPREANDICYYPRSNKIYFCGVDLIARLEPLDYWDGEE